MKYLSLRPYFTLKRLCIAWLVVFMVPFILVNGISLLIQNAFPHCMRLHEACAVTIPQLALIETAIYNSAIYGIIAITMLLSFKVASYIMNKVKGW